MKFLDALKSCPRVFWLELKATWRLGGGWMARHWKLLCLLTLVILAGAWLLAQTGDGQLSRLLWLSGEHPLRPVSNAIGHWGDFAQYNFAVVGSLWFAGVIWRRKRWRRAAVAAFLGAVLAGIICNEFRFAVGRPRPQAEFVDVPRGPMPSSSYHGFPSGHTAVAFGTSTPVLMLCPQVGVPLSVVSGSVAWARMASGVHYPSDILVGAWIGVAFGMATGLGRRPRKGRRRKT